MVLQRQLAVRSLDVLLAGALLNPKDLVIVPFIAHLFSRQGCAPAGPAPAACCSGGWVPAVAVLALLYASALTSASTFFSSCTLTLTDSMLLLEIASRSSCVALLTFS